MICVGTKLRTPNNVLTVKSLDPFVAIWKNGLKTNITLDGCRRLIEAKHFRPQQPFNLYYDTVKK